jgi:hypothetical protein
VSDFKLGRRAVRHDPRTLRLAKYLELDKLPVPPTAKSWTAPPYPVFANDSVGDCTCAAAGHATLTWMRHTPEPDRKVSTDQILSAYAAVSGWDPEDPSTDRGAVELDVLNYWRRKGIAGHKIGGYVAVDPGKATHVRLAIDLFGGIYIGAALPLTARDQIEAGEPWKPVHSAHGADEPGSWGGHAMFVPAYTSQSLVAITWGREQRMSWLWWGRYVDEAYAILSSDFLSQGKSPDGIDVATLRYDLSSL